MAEWIEGKVCLVTGSTQGIGLASARALAAKGAQVVLVGRDRTRGEAALAQVRQAAKGPLPELLIADLSSMAEVRRLAAEFRATHDRLHVLLNNAGAIFMTREVTAEGYEKTFALDHLGYFLLTDLLLDLLKASAPARIVNVSSDAHRGGKLRLDDLMSEKGYNGMRAYCQAKLANVLFTIELSKRLEGTGVVANAVHPGMVASGFGRNTKGFFNGLVSTFAPLLLTPEKGARTSVYLASDPAADQVSGKYFVRCKPRKPAPQGRDETVARRLWEVSEQLVRPAPAAEKSA